jgi:peptidoglycan hydrolase-like protein with peptidoglycan-binding domain
MQRLLKQFGYFSQELDGHFGAATDAALRRFQVREPRSCNTTCHKYI